MPKQPPTEATAWSPLATALADYQNGAESATILVSSNLWEDEAMPVREYYRPDGDPLPALEEHAMDHCRGRVLDLGAGAGRHAVELERRGLDVTALDLCPQAVEVMVHRGVRGASCGDLWTLTPSARFDTIVMLMHGIGVVGDLAGLGRFLERLPELMAPTGQLLCDSADVRGLPGLDDVDDPGYLGEVTFQLRYRQLSGNPYPWLFIDPDSLTVMASAAGLSTDILVAESTGGYLARLTFAEAGAP